MIVKNSLELDYSIGYVVMNQDDDIDNKNKSVVHDGDLLFLALLMTGSCGLLPVISDMSY